MSEQPETPEQPEYEAESIKVLGGRKAVRKRPGMYIGDTSKRGLHHLIYEAVDNSIDEALAGHCDTITITLHEDNSVSIEDNGRGIPVEEHPQHDASALTITMTELHAGGKFDNKTYKVSGGLHGVGISVTNFLSEWLEVEVKREGKKYTQKFEKGEPQTSVEEKEEVENSGTKITFKPDSEVFEETEFHYDILAQRFRELAFLNQGLKIELVDERLDQEDSFKYEGGIREFVQYLNENRETIHPPLHFEDEKEKIELEVSIQYTDSPQSNIYSFANNINTEEGGTHLTGFKTALTRVINKHAEKNNMDISFKGQDVREGLTTVISVKHPDPQFEGQTKTKLGNGEVTGITSSLVFEQLDTYFSENPSVIEAILSKCKQAYEARQAAKQAKEMARKGPLEGTSLPGKLADCSSKDPDKTELFIVEGDSAGGSAKQGRERKYQAILPLRGKILNVEKSKLDKVFENKELKAMMNAVGTGVKDDFDLEEARYSKIIIATDADVDGSHIRTLLLTFLYRYMKPLIEAGYVYIAKPPLYKIKRGRDTRYVYTEDEKKKTIKEMGGSSGLSIQRYKGLGEMNPEQLWETTMNPENRVLKQVSIEDAVEADKIFNLLMGKEVEPRKNFIMENADEVVNLDV